MPVDTTPGHTVIIGGQRFVLQLIPCGVLRPDCQAVIGNGVVLDPMALLNEIDKLAAIGLDVSQAVARQQSRAGDSALSPDD
jgi:adenylosuccinate synthase